jgi:hypothetical protein
MFFQDRSLVFSAISVKCALSRAVHSKNLIIDAFNCKYLKKTPFPNLKVHLGP